VFCNGHNSGSLVLFYVGKSLCFRHAAVYMRVELTCRFHHGIACTVRSVSVESDNDFRKVQGPVIFFREASFGADIVLTVIAAEYTVCEIWFAKV